MLVGYCILVDGTPIAKIHNGQTRTVAISPGRHQLALRAQWLLRSSPLEIDLQPGEQVNLTCRARGSFWEGIALAWGKPSRYLQLQWAE
jgi:hypothetical protein